jgi:putative ABC transport system permease protein
MDALGEQGGFVQAYLPLWQYGGTGRAVVLKTAFPPEALVSSVRQQVQSLDPELPIYDLRTLSDVRHRSLAAQRLNLTLLGLFAGVALTLVVVGIYGVLAYAVTQRTREIGVRVALGATRGKVVAQVVGHGIRLVGLGLVLGLAAALGLTRLLISMLYETRPTDPATFLGVSLLLVIASLFASWLPARRAAKIDPMVALRTE